MRITRDSLLTLAKDISALRFRQDRDLVCIYLTGSMRLANPLLGGAADIDLVFVHSGEPPESREVQKINDDVSLDIAHLPQSAFEQPRRLRSDPWLGSFLCENPLLLQENHHWFEFTQAAVCAAFHTPASIQSRVRGLIENSRSLWFSLQSSRENDHGNAVRIYLKAVEEAVNACACLYGPPLTERRFLLDFSALMENQNQPGLAVMARSLVCNQPLDEGFWSEWLPAWKEALIGVGKLEQCPKKLLPARHMYYIKSCTALVSENPAAAFWILLRTWSQLEEYLPQLELWKELCGSTGFDDKGISDRLESLDQFLDIVDEMVEKWEKYNGLK